MSEYTNILIASDLSENSVILCRKAQTLAAKLNAKLSIIHVVEHVPMLYPGGEFVLPLNFEMEENLAKEAKENIAEQAKHHNIDKSNQWVVFGDKGDEIVKFVNDHNIDLIVIGAHDKHGLHVLFGSTTDSVVHALPCDVLAIKVKQA